jgi:hypothetical protein
MIEQPSSADDELVQIEAILNAIAPIREFALNLGYSDIRIRNPTTGEVRHLTITRSLFDEESLEVWIGGNFEEISSG